MRLRSLVLALSLVAPLALGCSKAPAQDPDPVANTHEEIKNGADASAYPEAVLVDILQGNQVQAYCSGSLIAPGVVLTAGHCVFQFSSWRIHAPYANNQTATASSGALYDWADTQESVDPTMHDIGLIFLNTDITLASYPTLASSPVANGTSVVNVGRICSGTLETTKLCVGSVTVKSGASEGYNFDYAANDIIESGDSGGPDEIPGHVIVSVNSGGGSDEVLARVDLVYSWIQQQISAHGGSGASGSVGSTSTSATTGGSGGGSGDSCDTCANAAGSGACAQQYNACGNSQDCVNLDNCLGQCGSDANCANSCASQYQAGVSLLNAYDDCICTTACPSQCASECGSSSSSTGAGAGSTTGVGVGVGTGVGSGATTGGFAASTGTGALGAGGAGNSGAGGAGGGLGDTGNAGDNGGCNFGSGSDSAPWSIALLGLALAAAARRRSQSRRS